MTLQQQLYLEIGQGITNAVESQMFGKPCFKINGKAFICFFQEQMVFKLTTEIHAEALRHDGSKLFDPSGKNRPMKEWVQVPFAYKKNWRKFAEEAMYYVLKNSQN